MMLHLSRGEVMDQRDILRRLAELQYSRNDVARLNAVSFVFVERWLIFFLRNHSDAVESKMFDDEVDYISILTH